MSGRTNGNFLFITDIRPNSREQCGVTCRLAQRDDQIKVPAHAWRCNVDQIDGLVVSCPSIPSFAHADNHSRRTRTRTSAAERGCLSPRASAIWRPSRWGQSAVHLAACAVALWPCAAHGPPLAAHLCVTPLAIISWLAKQDRIERELSTTRLSLSQLQNKSSDSAKIKNEQTKNEQRTTQISQNSHHTDVWLCTRAALDEGFKPA